MTGPRLAYAEVHEAPNAVVGKAGPTIAAPTTQEILAAPRDESLAVMLYGSRARGDATDESDVDVLQVVTESANPYSFGSIAVSPYTPEQLLRLAREGSLFGLHLVREGVVLSDPDGVLARIVSEYQQPESYEALRTELDRVAFLLDAGTEAVGQNPKGKQRTRKPPQLGLEL